MRAGAGLDNGPMHVPSPPVRLHLTSLLPPLPPGGLAEVPGPGSSPLPTTPLTRHPSPPSLFSTPLPLSSVISITIYRSRPLSLALFPRSLSGY